MEQNLHDPDYAPGREESFITVLLPTVAHITLFSYA